MISWKRSHPSYWDYYTFLLWMFSPIKDVLFSLIKPTCYGSSNIKGNLSLLLHVFFYKALLGSWNLWRRDPYSSCVLDIMFSLVWTLTLVWHNWTFIISPTNIWLTFYLTLRKTFLHGEIFRKVNLNTTIKYIAF